MWLLLVEDDRDLADSLQTGLEEEGYRVDVSFDGLDAEARALANDYDALVVDWMLPGQDGRALVRRLREAGSAVAVLMLTAMADVDYRIRGLDAGADDYLTKPFVFAELYARLRALQRRRQQAAPPVVEVGALRIEPGRHRAEVGGKALGLRAKEYALLAVLAARHGGVVTRTVLAEQVWGSTAGVSDDVINMTVSSLRHKLNEVGSPIEIRTLRGVGYTLAAGE